MEKLIEYALGLIGIILAFYLVGFIGALLRWFLFRRKHSLASVYQNDTYTNWIYGLFVLVLVAILSILFN